MPELPEVEIVKRGMEPALVGQTIERVSFNRPNLRFPLPERLKGELEGRRLKRLQRRGKYILGFVESGAGFVLHLGMSGVITIYRPDEVYEPKKHDHVVIDVEGGGRVVFNDARRFGFLQQVHEDSWNAQAPFGKMGPEPLENSFSGPVLLAALKGRRGPIKTALLDQSIVAGVGNIYACEALFMAGIAPERAAGGLSGDEGEALAGAIQSVLREAIAAGGSSLRDYRNTKGKLGYFQHHFQVYDREGFDCPSCAGDNGASRKVVRIAQSGRSTFYCPHCQA